ncbi:MAG: restriction endonuclease subunit S [Bacteroidota bacterium]
MFELAFQGRLTAQNPRDKQVPVSYEEMQEKKRSLISEKKIKPLQLRPIVSDECPHELPASWLWVRLGDVINYDCGIKTDSEDIADDAWVLDLEDIEKDSSVIIQRKLYKERNSRSTKSEFRQDDVLYGKLRPYLNKIVVADSLGYCTTEIVVLRPYHEIDSKYLLYAMKRPDYLRYVESKMYGMKMPRLGTEDAYNAYFPLAPVEEQLRIVYRIESLMNLCAAIRTKKEHRNSHLLSLNTSVLDHLASAIEPKEFTKHWNLICNNFDTLYSVSETVGQLRHTILQLAVQGRLVKQDTNDEPASILLEKIKTEKEKLIKEKKIKKTEPLPPIKPEEMPYELPKGWEWARFADVIELQHGHQFREYDFVATGIPVIKIGQCNPDGSLDLVGCDYIAKERESEFEQFKIHKDDLLMALTGGTLGKVTWVKQDYGVVVQNYRVGKFIPLSGYFDKRFIAIILRSRLFQSLVQGSVNQNAQPNIGKEKIELLAIPVPPVNEQVRIVGKNDLLLAMCEKIEWCLMRAENNHEYFAESVVREMVA